MSIKGRKVSLPAEAGILIDDNIYFFSSEYNLLYKVHIPDFVVSIVSCIPCDEVIAFGWFRKACFWNEKIIFIPSYAKKIWIYNLISNSWDSISINYQDLKLKFWGAIIYKDSVFLFGLTYPVILTVNLNNYSVSYIKIDYPFKRKSEDKGLFFTNAVNIGNMAFSPISISNQVIQFNLDTFEYMWHRVGNAENQYSGIDFDGSNFWISPGQSGKIVKWDGELKYKEFEVPNNISNRSYQFIGVICDGDRVLFLTQQDGDSLEIGQKEALDEEISLIDVTKRYVHMERYENGTIVLMRSDANIDIKWKDKWIKGVCEIDYKVFKDFYHKNSLWKYITADKAIYELKIFNLYDYIEIIIENSDYCISIEKNITGIGIWETMR